MEGEIKISTELDSKVVVWLMRLFDRNEFVAVIIEKLIFEEGC
jgi:hypothetical protein